MKVRLAPSALDDLARLENFLTEASPVAARRMTETIFGAVDALATLPDRGRPVGDSGLRDLILPFGRAAYLLRYARSAEMDELVVVRIRHSLERS